MPQVCTIFDLWNKKNELGEFFTRLITMNSVETTSSWIFFHVKCKDVFPYSPFALTYSHEAWQNNTCSCVSNMTCWNILDINEFQLKGNNDMMQCVTCNKFSLFAFWKEKSVEDMVKLGPMAHATWV